MMAEVYWIHLPEHTDMFTEGYIGMTTKTTKLRFQGHRNAARRTPRKNRSRIQNAIIKYQDILVVETLVICSREYALDLEYKLRPSPKIGWNLRMGGESFEAFSAVFSGQVLVMKQKPACPGVEREYGKKTDKVAYLISAKIE